MGRSPLFSLLEAKADLNEVSAFAPGLTLPGFEKTKYGYMIMHDKQQGAGQIYFSIIKKQKSLVKSL